MNTRQEPASMQLPLLRQSGMVRYGFWARSTVRCDDGGTGHQKAGQPVRESPRLHAPSIELRNGSTSEVSISFC
jgi:hypothetical protein